MGESFLKKSMFSFARPAGVAIAISLILSAGSLPAQASPGEANEATNDSAVSIANEALKADDGLVPKDSITGSAPAIAGALPAPEGTGATGKQVDVAIKAQDEDDSVSKIGDDSSSLMTVLRHGDKAFFDLEIPDGYTPSLLTDGSVLLKDSESSLLYPFIKSPWALDANGKKLATNYEIVGRTLIQHVNTEGAQYPIVADPSIQWIPYPNIAMWGYEAHAIGASLGTILTAGAGGGCMLSLVGGIPGRIFAMVCGIVGFSGAKDVMRHISSMWASNGLNATTCYGFPVTGRGGQTVQPARDCQ